MLARKWKIKQVYGDDDIKEPSLCIFNNTSKVLSILDKHIKNNSRICLHTDIDMDGIGTNYILKKTLENLGSKNHLLLINTNKVHGIQQKHVDYFNKNNNIDLLIITDSSSNEVDIIKQFNCDVICIDHHDLLVTDTFGKCLDGIHDYAVINSTINNLNQFEDEKWLKNSSYMSSDNFNIYYGTKDMSCGLVVYELMRVYSKYLGKEKLVENLMLYQWVTVTLFTDVINTLNERNQYYIDKTVFNLDREPTLKIIANNLNKFNNLTDKNFINYTFAPLVNKAIRAGESAEALSIIINSPERILELDKYRENQEEAINKALFVNGVEKEFIYDNVCYNITDYNIGINYNGVIATKIANKNKNVAVYNKNNGLCDGSFRGRLKGIPYRKFFEDYRDNIYAQGHDGAFGFKGITEEELKEIMNSISSIEPDIKENIRYISIGKDIPIQDRGEYHFETIEEFKKQKYLLKVALGNSKVTSIDEINIRVKASDVILKETKGKLYTYNVLGLECKAFKNLKGKYFEVYAEYTNQIDLYIR